MTKRENPPARVHGAASTTSLQKRMTNSRLEQLQNLLNGKIVTIHLSEQIVKAFVQFMIVDFFQGLQA
jgi:hypothetical protein